jgi:ornithine cyclodeaminase/alanine dehydrogenase-like protein (mu-crystallin family)
VRKDSKVAGVFGAGGQALHKILALQNIIGWNKIHELGEILDGSFPGRTSDEQITFHANNNGTAAADLAIAQWVYEQCRRMGRGSPIELPRPGDQ